MIWKKNINDIQVKCKKDSCVMKLASTKNDKSAKYVCPICGEAVMVSVGKNEV